MPIKNERRHYLTLPDKEYKERLVSDAKNSGMSVSKYIVHCLDTLQIVEEYVDIDKILEKANGKST